MRLVSGAAQGASIHDHWASIRDCPKLARPATPSEAIATGDIHTPMPLTRAERQRIALRKGVGFVEQLRPYREPSAATLQARVQLEFHKRAIAIMGGSSTIKPMPREKSIHPQCPFGPEVSVVDDVARKLRQAQRFQAACELAGFGMGKGAMIARAYQMYRDSF